MKGTPTALRNHYAQAYQSTALCWKVTLQDNTVKAFTDHDRNLVISEGSPTVATTYLAASGYWATNVDTSDAMNVDNMEVRGLITSDSITEDDLRAGRWDHARVEIFRVNWSSLADGIDWIRVGTLGEVTIDGGQFKAELRGLTQAYSRVINELTSPSCLATLGDARCKVNLPALAVTGTITKVRADNQTIFDTSRTEDVGSPFGLSESASIYNLQPAAEGAHFSLAPVTIETTLPSLTEGGAIAIYGMTGTAGANEHLNGFWVARDLVRSSGVGFKIYEAQAPFGAQPTPAGTVVTLGVDSGYFDFGRLTWTSGLNDGISVEVRHYVPGMMLLALPMTRAIQVGDTYSLLPGCDKAKQTCIDKYNNVINFRGFPHLRGTDKVVQVARRG